VWRFDLQECTLIPVISRGDVQIPNGIRVEANQIKVYLTDSSTTDSFPTLQGGAMGTGSLAIFIWNLDDVAFPINKPRVAFHDLAYLTAFTLMMAMGSGVASSRKWS